MTTETPAVKRYDMTTADDRDHELVPVPTPHGDWMRSSDYDALVKQHETEFNAISATASVLASENARLVAERDALAREIEGMREALTWLINDVQEWCNAVDKDASWDGWDHHYKALAYGGLDKARAALTLSKKEQKTT